MSFADKLTERYKEINSLLCVGLDPRMEDLSFSSDDPTAEEITEQLLDFVKRIVDATSDITLAYKANAAFFESFGLGGYMALSSVRDCIPDDIPFILDAKRGDIADTAVAYATAVFDKLRASAVTVNGYLGSDGVLPFAENPEHGVFVLCKTSNASAGEIQDVVYLQQARLAAQWNAKGNIGLVVGATRPLDIHLVRESCRRMWILAPGIGAQGGSLRDTLLAGYTKFGGILINVSRGISRADDPRRVAVGYVTEMRKILDKTE